MVESRERRGAEVQEMWEEERGKEFLQGQKMKVTFQPLSAVELCYKISQCATSVAGQSRNNGLSHIKVSLG